MITAAQQPKVKGPRRKIEGVFDLDEADLKRRVLSLIGSMFGRYTVSVLPWRGTRSQQQNRWYWACVCQPLAEYLSEQDYDVTTADEAHEILRARFLAVSVVNRKTGERLCRRVRSTTELDTAEFAEYCERCRAWLGDFFGIIVPDPDPSWRTAADGPNG